MHFVSACSFVLTSVVLFTNTASAVIFAFMVLRDVPMYLHRWLADGSAGRVYFTLAAGLGDLAARCVVTDRIEDWREESPE